MRRQILNPMYLGLLAIAIVPALQAAWNAAGTDIKEAEKLVFVTAQKDIPPLISNAYGAIGIGVNFPLTPKSTKEWKMEGQISCVVGGIAIDEKGVAMVPYPDKKETKPVSGQLTYEASLTAAKEVKARPVSTTDDTRSLTRK
jgi:hypothetical protein